MPRKLYFLSPFRRLATPGRRFPYPLGNTMASEFEKVNIRLPKAVLDRLRAYAKAHGTTYTMLIRLAVDTFMKSPVLAEFKDEKQ